MILCVCGGIIEGVILFFGSFILTTKTLDFVAKLFRRRNEHGESNTTDCCSTDDRE